MLRGVLADGGTASGAAIPGWDLAGKTGTANEVINGQYSSTAYAASFIGFVPASHPRLLVAVMVVALIITLVVLVSRLRVPQCNGTRECHEVDRGHMEQQLPAAHPCALGPFPVRLDS